MFTLKETLIPASLLPLHASYVVNICAKCPCAIDIYGNSLQVLQPQHQKQMCRCGKKKRPFTNLIWSSSGRVCSYLKLYPHGRFEASGGVDSDKEVGGGKASSSKGLLAKDSRTWWNRAWENLRVFHCNSTPCFEIQTWHFGIWTHCNCPRLRQMGPETIVSLLAKWESS